MGSLKYIFDASLLSVLLSLIALDMGLDGSTSPRQFEQGTLAGGAFSGILT